MIKIRETINGMDDKTPELFDVRIRDGALEVHETSMFRNRQH